MYGVVHIVVIIYGCLALSGFHFSCFRFSRSVVGIGHTGLRPSRHLTGKNGHVLDIIALISIKNTVCHEYELLMSHHSYCSSLSHCTIMAPTMCTQCRNCNTCSPPHYITAIAYPHHPAWIKPSNGQHTLTVR